MVQSKCVHTLWLTPWNIGSEKIHEDFEVTPVAEILSITMLRLSNNTGEPYKQNPCHSYTASTWQPNNDPRVQVNPLSFWLVLCPYSFTLNMVTFAETSVNLVSKWPNVESRFSQPKEIGGSPKTRTGDFVGHNHTLPKKLLTQCTLNSKCCWISGQERHNTIRYPILNVFSPKKYS